MWFCCLVKVTNPVLSTAVLFGSLDTAWPTRTARFVLALAGAVGASGAPRRRAVFVRLWPHSEMAMKTRSLLVPYNFIEKLTKFCSVALMSLIFNSSY